MIYHVIYCVTNWAGLVGVDFDGCGFWWVGPGLLSGCGLMPTPTCLHNSNISSDLLSFFNSSTSIIMFLLYLVLVLFLGALQAHGENVDKGESGSGLLLFAFF